MKPSTHAMSDLWEKWRKFADCIDAADTAYWEYHQALLAADPDAALPFSGGDSLADLIEDSGVAQRRVNDLVQGITTIDPYDPEGRMSIREAMTRCGMDPDAEGVPPDEDEDEDEDESDYAV